MTLRLLCLILVSVSMSSVAQMLLKMGMARRNAADVDTVGVVAQILGGLLNPFVMSGLALYGLGAVLWLAVLARLDVSVAYPFVGLGFVMTMLIGYFVFGDFITPQRVVGTLLIVWGVILVARSAG